MGMERVIIVVIIASRCVSMASAIAGTATFYTTYVPSACYGYAPQGTMIAAANPEIFDNKRACGKMYRFKCTGPTNEGVPHPCRDGWITLKIVDLCPSCGPHHFDLSKEAFSMIADPDAGKIKIDYNKV